VGLLAVNHNSFHAVKFYCDMFRLIYKDPSSRWQGTKQKSYIQHRNYCTLALNTVQISTYIVIKHTLSRKN